MRGEISPLGFSDFQPPSSISRSCAATGDKTAPRRRTMPIVLEIFGSTSGTVRMIRRWRREFREDTHAKTGFHQSHRTRQMRDFVGPVHVQSMLGQSIVD